MKKVDVLIIGAGPAGTAAAHGLKQWRSLKPIYGVALAPIAGAIQKNY